jgi:L-serine deaminase
MNSNLTPEERHALGKLGLVDRNDPICEMVARKVIEIGATGVTDAVAIAEMAVRQLRP